MKGVLDGDSSSDGKRLATQLMKRILVHFRTQLDEELRPQGVTTAQLQVLHAIQGSPGSSGAQLARFCHVTPQTAQELIQRLEADSWIVRQKDKGNDRILVASLTAAGEELLRTAETAVMEIVTKLWAGVPVEEIDGVNRVLRRCLENIEGE